ncbi:MAG: family 78 glycoside hydrolase catalytic domain [Verrucomicrobia bacterium]|nr:family 78 glycoside hydrolase catalytic domain [Verrucomicrobiota bacterium]
MNTIGRLSHLRCEQLKNPLGIESPQPRLSWVLKDDRQEVWQTAYRIQVASNPKLLEAENPDLWDSGKFESRQSVLVPYGGSVLVSRQQAFWRVRIWDEREKASRWSKCAKWEMGLLDQSDWKGQWIGQRNFVPDSSPPCPFLRREFHLRKEFKRCRLYVSARGLFESYVNGERVGNDYFTPGWTEYDHRLEYCVYDISNRVIEGNNAMGIILGDGWYCGHLLFQNQRAHYGNEASLLAQIVADYSDGSTEVFATDDSWKMSHGPILESDLYHGEIYDAQREMKGWTLFSFDDSSWASAEVLETYEGKLVGKSLPPVRVIDERTPVSITEINPGQWILDLGQNMVGQYRLRVAGAEAGQKIELRFGEMLQADGKLYTENLRKARATDTYHCRGEEEEVYQARFTFHGYRYVEISGYPGELTENCFTGLVLHTAMEPTGVFECSDPLVNQLQSNIVWGQKGNFLDIPTDCPQRDERLGWTGDAQVFITTACFNFDCAAFFSRWLIDMALAQLSNGAVTDVVPAVLTTSRQMDHEIQDECRKQQGNAAWADAAVICPWVIYQRYGDKRVLDLSWKLMTRWVMFQTSTSENFIRPETNYGDWLATDAVEPGLALTPCGLIGTAYFSYTAGLVAKVAQVLGKGEEVEFYSKLQKETKEAFNCKYADDSGRLAGDTQTGYLLALAFDLLPESKQSWAIDRLVQLVEESDDHLSTGFVGTPLLCPVLSRFGRTDVAYRLLMQRTYPSWLYTVENGATTMWERWNSWTRESGFGDVSMNSFNHYAYGAIGQWLYATVAGIDSDPSFPGFERSVIKPQPGGGLSFAKGELKTPYGWLKSFWKISNGTFYLELSIPANTSAKVTLPSGRYSSCRVNSEELEETHNVTGLSLRNDSVSFMVRSGQYEISIPV